MPLEDYLAQGGMLTTPENAPPRYRGELMRLMATFVDSELAGAAGFADIINQGPGIKERIAAARIVLEKLDHAERVLAIMGEFGADIVALRHPSSLGGPRCRATATSARRGTAATCAWPSCIIRCGTGPTRWSMNVLMGHAVVIQLDEFAAVSYQPLGEIFRAILPRERRHMELGIEGLRKILARPGEPAGRRRPRSPTGGRAWPRVSAAAQLGSISRRRRQFGLRHAGNAELAAEWQRQVDALLDELSLR